MVDRISNYILDNILIKDEVITEEKREVLNFGLKRILEDIPKYAFIILICYILKLLPELGIVFLVTMAYKTFIGGAHARTNLECFVFSTCYFLIPILISKYVTIPIIISYILYAFTFALSLYVVFKIAPADTEEIPIINKKLRKTLRYGGFISLIVIYSICLVFIKNNVYVNMMVLTMFLIDICSTKYAYRFFKCKYSYESEEFKQYFK